MALAARVAAVVNEHLYCHDACNDGDACSNDDDACNAALVDVVAEGVVAGQFLIKPG
jgi:hypothetical protein